MSRVLHLLAPAPFGGLERVVERLALAQAESGRPVGVAAILDAGAAEPAFLTRLRGPVEVLPLVVPPRAYRTEQALLGNLMMAWKPAVLHTHAARPDVRARSPARRHGVALVSTTHGFTGGGLKNRMYEWLQCRSLRHFDVVVAVAGAMKPRLLAAGIPEDRLQVIPNAWPAPAAAPLTRRDARLRLSLSAEEYVLGWVGRLGQEKGLDVAIRALAMLSGHGAPITLLVIGAGREETRLRELAARLGVASRVRWAGAVGEAGSLFAAFDVFVLSSRTEGTPMVLFEAMAARVPVVATRVGGVPDVVGPDQALLVPAERPDALAAAITALRNDPDGAVRRAEAALARLAEFDETRARERYDRAYDAAIARSSSS
ncbi:MAG TPA: glycosyltransferase [Gemmatimonadales bacterium]|nr:glycosyltransferase [Gemmatimonadales bacterium]